MTTGIRCLCWLLYLTIFPLYAFHAETNLLQKQHQPEFSALYYQITAPALTPDDLRSDPSVYHAFKLLPSNTPQLLPERPAGEQTVWLFARLKNADLSPLALVLSYPFPHTDKVDIYQLNRDGQNITLLTRTGNHYPYTKRSLPYRSHAVTLELAAQETTDIYIRIQDSAVIPTGLQLWHQADFINMQQNILLTDSLLPTILLLLSLCCCIWFFRLKAVSYLYFTLFFSNLALVLLAVNGLGFALLWPQHPEINQAILYVCSGALLLSLSLLLPTLTDKSSDYSYAERAVYLSNTLLAVLVLFCPLYPDGIWRFWLLIAATGWVLATTALLAAFHYLNTRNHKSRILIWLSLLLTGCIILLLLNQLQFTGLLLTLLLICCNSLLAALVLNDINLLASQSPQLLTPHNTAPDNSPFPPQYYYDIYHNAVEGMFSTTLDGQILNANHALLNILGYEHLDTLKQDIAATGMMRFYADTTDRQHMLQQLRHDNNRSFEFRAVRSDGSPFWALMSARLSRNADGNSAFIHGSVIDITEQKLAHEKLAYLANHDPLTALYNRFYFEQQIQHACNNINRQPYCLLYIDIDQFRLINNSCSHSAGDALLRQFSEHLKQIIGNTGLIARLDSDEFGILLAARKNHEAFAIAYQLLESMKTFHFPWLDSIYNISISIGLAELSEQDLSADTVIKKADSACMIAKEQGRNRIHQFDETDQETLRHRAEIQWVSQLRQAIQDDKFILYQQPIQSVRHHNSKLHYELLLRLKDQDDNLIIPDNFIRSAERYGLMPKIDRWVISRYFRWLQQHPEHLKQLDLCSINVSGTSLADATFKDDIQTLFLKHQIPYRHICFEITESVAILNLQNTLNFIEHFRHQGCKFALDDFGSGFSSYGYLKHFPADFVKIDGSFVRDLLDDHYNKAIIKSIHEVAKAVNMLTIAEYVENNAILTELRVLGIDFVQGYAIADPAPLEDQAN
ncbi:EAL domain-containing protein [Chromatiaceae bacterium AAb-1]|nr:EAL domain-containing protein [Chromatiaceae bacterium AAb-1]